MPRPLVRAALAVTAVIAPALAAPGLAGPLPAGTLFTGALEAQTLRGGSDSLDRQNAQAAAHNFTYLRTAADVRRYVELGYLVPVRPNRDFDIHNVSFPYARPEVRLFIERLASQYRAACGEKLVVTSLTRPQANQPWNASSRSVHPTGMAVDLRRSHNANCRAWLERTLLSLESQGLVEAIYERNPPHYHVAVYPRPYAEHVARLTGNAQVVAQVASAGPEVALTFVEHRVARGETLSRIAERHGVAITRLRAENGIRGDRILAGQVLRVPVYRPVTTPATGTRVAEAPARAASSAQGLDEGGSSASAEAQAEAALHHTVRPGESLWAIARRHGITVDELAQVNGIRGSRIQPGQVLEVPVVR